MNYQDSLSEADEEVLILYPSRQKMLLLLAGSLVFVVAGVFLFLNASNLVNEGLDVFTIVFFGLCALVLIFMLVKSYPLLQMNDEGFRQWSLWGKNYLISWEEIAFIFLSTGRLSSSLNIYLSETGLETFSARYPWRGRFCRLFGRLVMVISSSMSPVPVQEILETMQKRYQRRIEQYDIYVR